MKTSTRHRIAIGIAAASGLLLISGCSSNSSNSAGSSDAAGPSSSDGLAPGPAPNTDARKAQSSGAAAAPFEQAAGSQVSGQQPVIERQVISTGTITLQSDDIAAARSDAIDIVQQAGGHIDNEDSQSGTDGKMTSSNLVFRVPAANFDSVMNKLAGVADAVHQTRKAEDVTTKVIDVAARIRVQQDSIRRLETLYSHAKTIGQIISLENQISRRQADLDSLKHRQAYLRNQTSFSTITAIIEEPDATPPETKPATVHHGFLKGLYGGWDAFVAMTMGILAAVGAVLPFLGAIIVLVAGYRMFRRVRA